jgi:hypothetical protein
MFKWIFTLILSTLLSSSLASTVRLSDTDNPIVNVGNYYNIYNTLGGDGTSTSAPLKLYMPISNGANQTNNHVLESNLFTKSSTDTLNITIDFTNTDNTNLLYPTLYADDQGSTNYKFVARSSVGCSTNSSCNDLVSSFSIASICASSEVDCDTPTEVKTQTLYLLFSQSAIDTDITDPTSGTDGIFIELNISGVVYDGTNTLTIQPVLTSVGVGDTRLKYNYTLSSVQTYFRDIVAYDNTLGLTGSSTFSTLNASKELLTSDDEIPVTTNGYFDLKDLTNEKTYHTTIAIRDRFGFYTLFADSLAGQSLSIAQLLEKNQCYLITAGFQEQHYVLDYFRHIRDDYLLGFELGERFVNFYYATAPHYVPYIIDHKYVQVVIKSLAFLLYFVLNYGAYILGIAFLVRFLKFIVSKLLVIQ